MLNAAKSSHKLSNPGKSFSTFFFKDPQNAQKNLAKHDKRLYLNILYFKEN